MSKRDRQAVRTARDIEQKYNLGAYDKRMNEAKNIAESARADVENIFEQAKETFQEQLDEAVRGVEQSVEQATATANEAKESAALAEEKSKKNEEDIALLMSGSGSGSPTTFDAIYPIGSIYLTVNDTDPGTLFPDTTWEKLEGVIPWFVNGELEVVISDEDFTVNTGGDGTDVPPYIQIYAWRRVEEPVEEGDVIGSEN